MLSRLILKYKPLLLLFILVAVVACRDDEYVVYMEDNILPPSVNNEVKGMYLICEGNMGSNKCTLDYLDLSNADGQVHYYRNIYATRNPNTVKELGDVGNDIQIYGSKLWMVINCSNKVEVCSADSCKRIGQINIPNCRYVTFDGGYAYVSSYAGPVQLGSSQIGRIYKVDTLSLQVVGSVDVGRQPEEMAIIDGKLYVANSGGYTPENYDHTISVVDINTMTEERKIDLAVNLHRLKKDKYNQLWITSRGDYYGTPSRLYCLNTNGEKEEIDVPVSEMCIVGDTLYYIGVEWSYVSNSNHVNMGLINVRTHEKLNTTLFDNPEVAKMKVPYGIAVNPTSKDIYLMDAKDYVSSGTLICLAPDGTFRWKQKTGDIPSRACFVTTATAAPKEDPYKPKYDGNSPYILAVDEYVPAPGQFINTMPKYEDGDDAKIMAQKCTDALADDNGGLVSLGGFGGYITFHFDHSVRNVPGEKDIYIKGNAFKADNASDGGSSEPGIVMVSQDLNGNGLPDDEWYELSGSADVDSVGKVMYDYAITYTFDAMKDVPWTDNRGNKGTLARNSFHRQEYFPLWLKGTDGTLTLRGTRLPNNGYDASGKGTYWVLKFLRYGYVDNLPNTDRDGCSFDIGWAVHPVTRQPKALESVDFVRVYCATNQVCGWLGETSTEIMGAEDLHFSK
ncbi:MAG: hypothetical protein KBT34_13755 [Prevotella sp.]|nr:hypothetical protein [Candidatus Prevotella equi]